MMTKGPLPLVHNLLKKRPWNSRWNIYLAFSRCLRWEKASVVPSTVVTQSGHWYRVWPPVFIHRVGTCPQVWVWTPWRMASTAADFYSPWVCMGAISAAGLQTWNERMATWTWTPRSPKAAVSSWSCRIIFLFYIFKKELYSGNLKRRLQSY